MPVLNHELAALEDAMVKYEEIAQHVVAETASALTLNKFIPCVRKHELAQWENLLFEVSSHTH